MRNAMFILFLLVSICSYAAIDTYAELVSRTAAACHDRSLFSSTFTNDVIRYKSRTTETSYMCAADVALSLYFMNQYDKRFDTSALTVHNALVSNVLFNVSIPADSWIRYAAGFEYINGLNIDGRSKDGLVVTTNLIASATMASPWMGVTNFWNAMMDMENCRDATVLDALRLNAAVELYENGELSQLRTYTNALPSRIYQYYLEEVE